MYLSQNLEVEHQFERTITSLTSVNLLGVMNHLLGIKFIWTLTDEKHLSVHMSQEAYIEQLGQSSGLLEASTTSTKTPYRSGLPVDSIPPSETKDAGIISQYRSYVGSLLWIIKGTIPDITAIL